MLVRTISMQWLWDVVQEYRSFLKLSLFYKTVAVVSSSADFKWIWQLYYLSSDFAAAVALRYGGCHDPSFRDSLGQHTAEEVEHPKDLADWMREHGFWLQMKSQPQYRPC